MDTRFSRFRSLSIWAYVCLFGALWGYTVFGVIEQKGSLVVWVALALVGSKLMGMKNRLVPDPRVRGLLFLSDLLITVTLLALINLMPAATGQVRGAIILILESAYIAVYTTLLFKRKLVVRTHYRLRG